MRVEGSRLSLVGQNWLKEMQLDWVKHFQKENDHLSEILRRL